jgi:hypothetical protein
MTASGMGSVGGGMKLKKPLSPNTKNTVPSKKRAAVGRWRATNVLLRVTRMGAIESALVVMISSFQWPMLRLC